MQKVVVSGKNDSMTVKEIGVSYKNLQVILAMAESAVICLSAAILLAIKSGHEVPAASAVKAMM